MSNISNLQELRSAKKELRKKLAQSDLNATNGFLMNTVDKFINSASKTSKMVQTPVGSGVSSALHFVSKQAQNRLNLGKTGKTILSIAILVATPIVVKKVQELIDEKL